MNLKIKKKGVQIMHEHVINDMINILQDRRQIDLPMMKLSEK